MSENVKTQTSINGTMLPFMEWLTYRSDAACLLRRDQKPKDQELVLKL